MISIAKIINNQIINKEITLDRQPHYALFVGNFYINIYLYYNILVCKSNQTITIYYITESIQPAQIKVIVILLF